MMASPVSAALLLEAEASCLQGFGVFGFKGSGVWLLLDLGFQVGKKV